MSTDEIDRLMKVRDKLQQHVTRNPGAANAKTIDDAVDELTAIIDDAHAPQPAEVH